MNTDQTKKDIDNENLKNLFQFLNKMETNANSQKTDRYDDLGFIVAKTLREINSEMQRLYTEKLINDVLFFAKINELGSLSKVVAK